MGRGITENDVHGAADEIVTTGERPTVERIRAHLGTGSPNTVVRWLDTWWKGLGKRLREHEAQVELPEAPEAVARLAGKLWAVALEHAETAAHAASESNLQALDAARAALNRDREAFNDEAATLRQQMVGATQAQDLAAARAEELERLVSNLEAQIVELSSQRTAAAVRADEAEAIRQTVQVRLQALQEEIASERDSRTRHVQATEDRAHAEVDRTRQEVGELKKQLALLAKERAATETASQKQLDAARREAAGALQEAAVQRGRAETLEAQLSHLHGLPAALEAALQQAKGRPKARKVAKRGRAAAKK